MKNTNNNYVPEEISIDILSRLPASSVLRCSLVCKSWRNLIFNDHDFARMHLMRELDHHHGGGFAGTGVNFLLLTRLRDWDVFKLYSTLDDDDNNSNIRFRELPSNPNSYNKKNYCVVGSCNGLICMAYNTELDNSDEGCGQPIYITNPTTREWLTIPTLIFNRSCHCLMHSKRHVVDCNIAVCGFGYLPSTNEYKVVRIYYYLQGGSPVGRVHVYTLGDGNGWRDKGEIPYTLQNNRPQPCLPSVLANGALHWLDEVRETVVAFDLAAEEFSLIPSPPSCFQLHYGEEYRSFQIKVLGGQLCAVFRKLKNSTVGIWALKKNEDKKNGNYDQDENNNGHGGKYQFWSWIKEYDIKGRYLTPIILTKQGDVLSYEGYNNRILCHELKSATSKELMDMDKCLPDFNYYSLEAIILPHLNSFISLKALGEEEEEEEDITKILSKKRRRRRRRRRRYYKNPEKTGAEEGSDGHPTITKKRKKTPAANSKKYSKRVSEREKAKKHKRKARLEVTSK